MDQDPGSCGGVCFSHDVFNVFFDRLLGDLERVGDFFICPPLCQVFHDRLFPIRELKLLLGLVSIQLLPSAQLF